MGDKIAITTYPKHQNMFYHITSSALSFDVKASGNAGIGLAKSPGRCDYWVGIGDETNRCWIKRSKSRAVATNTPNVLDYNEYRSFWLTWHGGTICLGRGGESTPIVTHTNLVEGLNYITFVGYHDRNSVDWRFELPPVFEQPKVKPVSGGQVAWVEAENQLPDGALIGGQEKEILYIIRAPHRGSLTPGKFVPSEGVGYISWGGEACVKSEFEVLCGFDCIWTKTRDDRIPVGAVLGGYSESSQERLYVGRALHEGHLIPGKVQPSHKVCYIPYEGKEIAKQKYEILVDPTRNNRSAYKYFINESDYESGSESEESDDNHGWDDDDL